MRCLKVKKAQFELSLNWIYIIIVGIFIIFLFTKIGFFSIKKSEFDSAEKIADYFNNILSELYSTYNQMGYVNLKNIHFEIIEENGFNKIKYKNKISGLKTTIFSPKSLEGNISYWSYGYKRGVITNKILFLSDKKYKYIIYYAYGDNSNGDNFEEKLLEELPDNYDDYFNIIFTQDIDEYLSLKNKKILCLDENNLLDENKKKSCDLILEYKDKNYILEYKDKNSDEYTSYYVYTPNDIFISLFSNDKKSYEDIMNLIEEKNFIVLDLFEEKILFLETEYGDDTSSMECTSALNSIKEDFERIKKTKIKNDNNDNNNIISQKEYESIIKDIKEKNISLFRNNCKTIY